ncbi:PREDICTED: rho GTPase-activating protein 15 [Nanorana parkeri]|uniref:rho GTPase-activating protein 15 n=1 Tax=Nanorana parkeri TaxID=125878 RepID=UPI000854F9AC|nr:PREDICTED: rho GTPase-activating protein 15 [Nanorana parkeri]
MNVVMRQIPVWYKHSPYDQISKQNSRINVILEPPNPSGRPVQLLGQWEEYEDVSGRKFYVHIFTKERSWKPPRSVPPKKDAKVLSETAAETLSNVKNVEAVQMRIKSPNSQHERLSQSKSMVIIDPGEISKQISRHRRNHSQHYVTENRISKDILVSQSKEGILNKTKIADRGKKLRKNWVLSYVVLSEQRLEFFKDAKDLTPSLKSGTKSECVDLCGAVIEWTSEKSSRKNVFQITTLSGSEILLQSDVDITIKEWFHAIRNTIDSLATRQLFPPLGISVRKSASSELLHSGAESREKKTELRKSLVLRLNYSASDTSDKSRVKTRLKKFISRRPSLKTLQDKGIIKDQAFGCHLAILCQRENSTVPQFVRTCIEAVEKRGLDVDGLYRVSGNLSTIQKLRFIVNHEEKLNLDDSQWEDIHVVTGALKMFFRELSEPLFPRSFFEQFVEAIRIQDSDLQVKTMRNLVKQLPVTNHDTMKALFEHLRRIVINTSTNLMSTQSLGIVFGPTLLRPESDAGSMTVHMVYQNQIVELMITKYEDIFC